MVKAKESGLMVILMKVNGLRVKRVVRVNIFGLVEIFMKVNI